MRNALLVFAVAVAEVAITSPTISAQTMMANPQATRQPLTHPLVLPPRSPVAPPLGITVQMQSATVLGGPGGPQVGGWNTPPFSLDKASVATLAMGGGGTASSPNIQATPSDPRTFGTATIDFAPGNTYANWLFVAQSRGVPFTLIITNVTSAGTYVYTLLNAQTTDGQTGANSDLVYTVKYHRILWTYPGAPGTAYFDWPPG